MNRTGFIGDSLVMSVLKNEKKPEERTKLFGIYGRKMEHKI